MAFLSDTQRDTLTRICETLAPRFPQPGVALYATGAHDVGMPALLELALERAAGPADRVAIRLFLSAIEHAPANRALCGIRKPFAAMTHAERERLLQTCALSPHAPARQLFQAFKRLGLFVFYSAMPGGQPNPTWQTFGYRPPPVFPPADTRIQPLALAGDTLLTCDALVIGSGAGGGVAAGELAAAGFDVLVVEKGPQRASPHVIGQELAVTEALFEKHGTLSTRDQAIVVLAGSTLGGGTAVNWAGALRTPPEVLDEWARVGFPDAVTPAYAASIDAVCARLQVDPAPAASAHNRMLEAGCAALDYDCAPLPQNRLRCPEDDLCGFCSFGCATGAKQSTARTFLEDAAGRGARFLVNARVERILIEAGRAVGAQISARSTDGQPCRVTVRARLVIAAGGALHTPALLLRSGMVNAQIGANLRLHPTTVVYGFGPQRIEGWHGAPMTRISRQFADLDGRGHGVRLECAPLHPGIAALTIPWESARQHRDVMANLAHLSNIIIITRDRDSGRVSVDRRGEPVLHYRLSRADGRHLRRGIVEGLRVLHAAGADVLSSPHHPALVWRRESGADFDAYLEDVLSAPTGPNQMALFSAHQMGTCRIGPSSDQGALLPTGESYEVRGLYVLDGSAMPTCSGVNPMISIMALSHYLAQGIRARGLPRH